MCADEETSHAWGGFVVESEVEGILLPPPTPDGRGEYLLNFFVDVQEGGRAGTAVEVFVGAADGEVCVTVVEVDGDGADRVAEIPEDERAFNMGEFGDAAHVVDVAAFEGNVGEGDEGCVFIDGGFECVEVGGDVVVEGTNSDDFVVSLTSSPLPRGGGTRSSSLSLRSARVCLHILAGYINQMGN